MCWRQRRNAFYIKNGYTLSGVKYSWRNEDYELYVNDAVPNEYFSQKDKYDNGEFPTDTYYTPYYTSVTGTETAKILIWDNWDDMKPLAPSFLLGETFSK